MSDTINMSGGCACGAIRYTSHAKPEFSYFCQCRQCQQSTGTGHAAAFIASTNTTTITGELKFWSRQVSGGNSVNQGFCPQCGSPVLSTNSSDPTALFINAGTLDNPEQFTPQRVLFHNEAQPWDHLDPSVFAQQA